MSKLTKGEINRIVNQYIGVSNGYLGDFSYRTHGEFYLEYCDLDIDPSAYTGTTRERFIAILDSQEPANQAKILRGVLERFPLNANGPATRTEELRDRIFGIIQRLEGFPTLASPELKNASEIVKRAIAEVEKAIKEGQPISGIDRIHTAMHGYLKDACDKAGISSAPDDTMVGLLKLLQKNHPHLKPETRSQDIEKILRSFFSVLDALNPIRNNASLAHPNSELLEVDEAYFVINASKTLLYYLDAKLNQ